MQPTTPVLTYIPDGAIIPSTVTFAKCQPEYNPLPTIEHGDKVTSRWKFTLRERLHVLFYGYIFITQKNFGEPLQPILPSIEQPKPWR